ncbi:unnamed protein product [Echinostoma caproni]|uniref:Protein SFI1 homolog n=1 Tax=Echinostoma caproni TaxID=27848 RepID=A0A183AG80_9TREM|nr:unnamed protein product [Echinostoma caproni]
MITWSSDSKTLLCHVIKCWYRYVVLRRKKRYLRRVASLHFIERTRHYRLIEWYRIWVEQTAVHLEHEQAVIHWRLSILYQCFRKWYGQLVRSRQLEERAMQMRAEADRTRLRLVLSRWHAYQRRNHRNKAIVAHKLRIHDSQLLGICFNNWKHWTCNRTEQAILIRNFLVAKQSRRLKQIFSSWHAWTGMQREKREQMQQAEFSFREKSRTLALHSSFNRWSQSLAMKRNLELAHQHALHRLMHTTFHHWRAWCAMNREKLRMKLAANRFHSVTLQMTTIKNWYEKYKESCRLRKLGQIALYRWSLCLQAQVWTAWRLWVKQKKEKRSRQEFAIHRFREYLAKEAFATLIRAAMLERQRTQIEFCHRFWDSDFRTFHLALNASRHWRFWTRRRVQHFATQSHLTPHSVSRQVTVELDDNMSLSITCHGNPSNEAETPIAPNVPNNVPYGAFDLQPACPDFLLPDLEAQGILPTIQPEAH